MLTAKQQEVIRCIQRENPKILICSGAKRAGKTFVLNLAYLGHIQKYRNKGLSFIIGGATQASIRRNILDDMELILGKELKLDKTNAVKIFGNKVYCFDGQNADAWKKARGFTSAGAFLNEGTALHDTFVKECISRCSYPGARTYIDTNPENPGHSVKKDYIDKDGDRLDNGQLNIKAFKFTLFDNTTLDSEYVESIIKSTPSGMFAERDIYGNWVSAEGIVYPDFSEDLYISETEIEKLRFSSYYCGVDWGYEHFGIINLFGETNDDLIVLIKEFAAQHQEIEYWVDIAKKIRERYGNIFFYCDSARPEHVQRFKREGIRAVNADKSILAGIEQVARRFKTKTLLINKGSRRFKEEIVEYCWNEKAGEPIKLMDDSMDATRYAVYTRYTGKGKVIIRDRRELGI